MNTEQMIAVNKRMKVERGRSRGGHDAAGTERNGDWKEREQRKRGKRWWKGRTEAEMRGGGMDVELSFHLFHFCVSLKYE